MSPVCLEVGAVGLRAAVACVLTSVAVSGVSGRCPAGRYLGAGRDGDAGGVPRGTVGLGFADRSSAVRAGFLVKAAVSFVACFRSTFSGSAGAGLGCAGREFGWVR